MAQDVGLQADEAPSPFSMPWKYQTEPGTFGFYMAEIDDIRFETVCPICEQTLIMRPFQHNHVSCVNNHDFEFSSEDEFLFLDFVPDPQSEEEYLDDQDFDDFMREIESDNRFICPVCGNSEPLHEEHYRDVYVYECTTCSTDLIVCVTDQGLIVEIEDEGDDNIFV